MQEFIEMLISRLEEEKSDWNYDYNVPINKAIEIVNQLAEDYNNGWRSTELELPPMPKENPLFDNKPLELYLVSMGSGYPWRAFWNGKYFTDGWRKVEPKAWQPLPPDYQPKGENNGI